MGEMVFAGECTVKSRAHSQKPQRYRLFSGQAVW